MSTTPEATEPKHTAEHWEGIDFELHHGMKYGSPRIVIEATHKGKQYRAEVTAKDYCVTPPNLHITDTQDWDDFKHAVDTLVTLAVMKRNGLALKAKTTSI